MNRKKLLKHLVILMFFMFILNSIAEKLYWYTSIWSFDMVMHFLGGFWVGLFFMWFFSLKNMPFSKWFSPLADPTNLAWIYKTVIFVLLIGLLWELFEFLTNNYIGRSPFSILDTLSDIFFDLSGGTMAVLYLLKRIMITERTEAHATAEL